MPALLAMLDVDDVRALDEEQPELPPLRPEVLEGVLDKVRWRRRRSRLLTSAAVGLAAALVAVGLVIAVRPGIVGLQSGTQQATAQQLPMDKARADAVQRHHRVEQLRLGHPHRHGLHVRPVVQRRQCPRRATSAWWWSVVTAATRRSRRGSACPAQPRCRAETPRCRRRNRCRATGFGGQRDRCCSNDSCEFPPAVNPGAHACRVTSRDREAGEAMVSRHRVVDHIVEYLAARGVSHVFGVDGANIEDLYDAAHFCDGITAVLAKHEFSAATMADGYSRGGAGLGVVAATSGGGSLNLVAGLGESFASRVPVLALIGQPPTSLDGRGSFQDTSGRDGALDALALFSAVSVYCRRVLTPATSLTALPEAIAAARTGGPAVLLLPKDIQQADDRRRDLGDGFERTAHRSSAIRGRSSTNCAARSDRSRSSPANRWPVTTRAPNSSSCARVLRARVATVPDAKDVSGHTGLGASSSLGVTGVMGHPGRRRRRSPTARCACWSAPGCR